MRPVFLVLALLAGCSGGSKDRAADADAASDPSPPDQYALVSSDGFLAVPPPACEEWAGFGCNTVEGCNEGWRPGIGEDGKCPACVAASASDPTTCDGWQEQYRDFLITTISGSCANYCDGEVGCSALEITNACGTYALPLTGFINEEIVANAESFARENCGVCGEVEQTAGALGSTFQDYEQACIEHRCVLVPRAD